jgi:ADP-dependent NAD(P)H-hydrate dehydratase
LMRSAEENTAIIFDAGAIKAVGGSKELVLRNPSRCIFTPHAGEMAGLMNMERAAVEADPAGVATRAAKSFGALFVLKGARTYIASPTGQLAVCHDGNVGLATSGSGDVLAGVITGLAARGADPFAAATWGVFLHAKAGDRLADKVGPLGYLARELLDEIPKLLRELG